MSGYAFCAAGGTEQGWKNDQIIDVFCKITLNSTVFNAWSSPEQIITTKVMESIFNFCLADYQLISLSRATNMITLMKKSWFFCKISPKSIVFNVRGSPDWSPAVNRQPCFRGGGLTEDCCKKLRFFHQSDHVHASINEMSWQSLKRK